MRIFLSHANDDKHAAESLAFSLRNRGHSVFLDRDDLPPGETYDKQIELAVRDSDLFIFLISPASVVKGRYTLTELSFARKRWPDPHGRLLPVMVSPTPMDTIPSYLKAVTILEPLGSVTAETAAAVDELGSFSRAKAVAWKFAAFGAAAGALASFLPYTLPSLFGFRIFGVAPDIGICLGITLAFAAYKTLNLRDKSSLIKNAAIAVILWFPIGLAMGNGQLIMLPNTETLGSDLSIFNEATVDEETKEKITARLQSAETYSFVVSWIIFAASLIFVGAAFATLLNRAIGYALDIRISASEVLTSLSLGGASGLLWAIISPAVALNFGEMVLIKPDGPDTFAIWSSAKLMMLMTQWLALTCAAVGFNLGSGYSR